MKSPPEFRMLQSFAFFLPVQFKVWSILKPGGRREFIHYLFFYFLAENYVTISVLSLKEGYFIFGPNLICIIPALYRSQCRATVTAVCLANTLDALTWSRRAFTGICSVIFNARGKRAIRSVSLHIYLVVWLSCIFCSLVCMF